MNLVDDKTHKEMFYRDNLSFKNYIDDWTSAVTRNPEDRVLLDRDLRVTIFKKDFQPVKSNVKAKYINYCNVYAKRRYRRNKKLLHFTYDLKQIYPLAVEGGVEEVLNKPLPLTFKFDYDSFNPANQMEGK